MGDKRSAYRTSVGKPEGKLHLVKRRNRCENNIKMNLIRNTIGNWDGLI
jgi:hypothetical protein